MSYMWDKYCMGPTYIKKLLTVLSDIQIPPGILYFYFSSRVSYSGKVKADLKNYYFSLNWSLERSKYCVELERTFPP